MKKADPYYRIAAAVFAIGFTAFLSYFLASNNKITAEEATSISQIQTSLVIADKLEKINKSISNIEGYLRRLDAELSTYSPNTRMRN